jgi:urea transport system ATP-binding protein
MPNNTDFVLAVEGVSVSFDGFKVVNDLSLYIDKGELRVIIGPNGAGKTTVLDLICGRTRATEGAISFKNQYIGGLKEHEIVKLGIGRKFQTPSIYEDLTVFEKPGDLVSARPQRHRRAVLEAERGNHHARA